jgi:hypothetical protein
VKSWCIPKASARFVAKMEDVLAVYPRPYNPKRPVVCVDEVSKELHSTPQGELPLVPGQTRCQDYEYARHGTCNLFLAVEPLRGWRKVCVTQRRTLLDFAELLKQLADEVYRETEVIVLVVDNLNTHTPAALYARFAPNEARRLAQRFEWHYTPEHGSWLNMAELELSVLTRRCLGRRMADLETVQDEVMAWQAKRYQAQVTIDWHFTSADARIKLKHLYPVTKE